MFKLFALVAVSVTSILLGDCACKQASPQWVGRNYQTYNRAIDNSTYRQYNRPTGNRWADPNYYDRQYNQPDMGYYRDMPPAHPPGYWSTSTEMVIPL